MKIFNKEVSTIKAFVFSVLFVLVGHFFTSPYYTAYQLRKAIDDNDVITFGSLLDMTSLRQMLLRNAASSGASEIDLAIQQEMMNNMLTPSLILADLHIDPDVDFILGYHSINRFVITNTSTGGNVWMKRVGLFSWKVYKVTK